MIYRPYGQTGKEVSVIGFGGMQFAEPENIDKNAAILKTAYDKGINYFDTAPMYCDDKSELIYGAALKEMQKTRAEKPFYVSTKTMKTQPGEVRKQIETSLERLNVDHIDFYHFWCILTLEDFYNRMKNGVLKEFEKLKDEGLIKHIVVSTHLAGDEIGQMLNEYPFEGILLGYSAMNFAYRDKGLDAAAQLDRGVVIMNPLGGGIIPQNPELFDFVKNRPDETVVQAAIRFLLNDSRITMALVGFTNEDHINEAVGAVDGFEPIPEEKIQKIRSQLKESFDQLCTGCQYCNQCAVGIPVPKMMDSYNHKVFHDNPDQIALRLYWHWGFDLDDIGLDKCTKCGLCEKLCTQKLPILERFEEIKTAVADYQEKQKK
jgi:hypothetical protein